MPLKKTLTFVSSYLSQSYTHLRFSIWNTPFFFYKIVRNWDSEKSLSGKSRERKIIASNAHYWWINRFAWVSCTIIAIYNITHCILQCVFVLRIITIFLMQFLYFCIAQLYYFWICMFLWERLSKFCYFYFFHQMLTDTRWV